MGRLLTTFGIILLIVGMGGTVVNIVAPSSLASLTKALASSPTKEQLCKAGEELVETSGASAYTPGQGYGHSVQYTCVNSAGARRDVTGNFVSGLVGQIPSFVSGIGMRFLWSGLITMGIILLIIGLIVSRLRGGVSRASYAQIYINGQPVTPSQTQGWSRAVSSSAGSLIETLRQLEEAHKAGLLSSDEYERLRQKALDNLK